MNELTLTKNELIKLKHIIFELDNRFTFELSNTDIEVGYKLALEENYRENLLTELKEILRYHHLPITDLEDK